jgi:hypothetical protein
MKIYTSDFQGFDWAERFPIRFECWNTESCFYFMQPAYYLASSGAPLREGDMPEITFDAFEITVAAG